MLFALPHEFEYTRMNASIELRVHARTRDMLHVRRIGLQFQVHPCTRTRHAHARVLWESKL